MMYVKTNLCRGCEEEVPTKFFSKRYSRCWYCIKKYRKDRYKRAKDWYKEHNRKYREEHKEYLKEYNRQYARDNRDMMSRKTRNYILKKQRAAPKWLTEYQKKEIEKFYSFSRNVSCTTKYEVDHIVPIRGKRVCGLHVPWNLQVITQEANRKKSNTYDDWS